MIARGEALLATVLARGMQRGEIRNIDLEIDTRLLIAPVIMMMMWKHSSCVCQIEPEKLNVYLEHYIQMAWNSLLIRQG